MALDKIMNLDPNEKIVRQVKRHPIGLIPIFTVGVLIFAGISAGLFYVVSNKEDLDVTDQMGSIYIVFGGGLLLVLVATYIAQMIYRTNELIVTDENIIQILQFGLFNRQISQLNLAKIQDVSVDQVGMIQGFFNYGVIEIETAGEQANFRFEYIANPNIVAKEIIEAHEEFIKLHSGYSQSVRL